MSYTPSIEYYTDANSFFICNYADTAMLGAGVISMIGFLSLGKFRVFELTLRFLKCSIPNWHFECKVHCNVK